MDKITLLCLGSYAHSPFQNYLLLHCIFFFCFCFVFGLFNFIFAFCNVQVIQINIIIIKGALDNISNFSF